MMSPSGSHTQRGVSLMEALAAVAVLALGLLSMLGMQLHTLTHAQDSLRRTQAIRLIDDLSERLKLQPDAIRQKTAYLLRWDSALAKVADDCAAKACTPAQFASYEINRWLATVKTTLPLGQAAVFEVAGDPRQLGVMLAWRANEQALPDAAKLPLAPPSTGTAAVSCPAQRICHLQYISLTQRCLSQASGAVYCGGI